MEWLWVIVIALLVLGVVLTVRERRTGRGKIIDERVDSAQTEADREAMRAQDATHHHTTLPHDHQ